MHAICGAITHCCVYSSISMFITSIDTHINIIKMLNATTFQHADLKFIMIDDQEMFDM